MDWVIGIGNDMRGDDGIGPALVSRLTETNGLGVERVQQLTPELAVSLSNADRVLFVDASTSADGVELRPVAPSLLRGLGHALSPAGLLDLTERAFGRAPTGWVLSVRGRSFDVGTGLSREAKADIDRAEDVMRQWVRRTAVTENV